MPPTMPIADSRGTDTCPNEGGAGHIVSCTRVRMKKQGADEGRARSRGILSFNLRRRCSSCSCFVSAA
jgi:hypothetical protein